MRIWQRWKQTAIHNKALVFTSILVAFGTLFYAGAAAFQLWLMNQSSKHTDTQIGYIIGNMNWLARSMDQSVKKAEQNNREVAQNAKDAIKNTQAQMRLDERAWVVLLGIGPAPQLNQPWNLDAVFTNTGKTPAKDVKWSCTSEFEKDQNSLKWSHAKFERPTLLAPNAKQMCIMHPLSIPKVTQATLDTLKDSKVGLFVYGSAVYKDIFNQRHWLTFCSEMNPDGSAWETCTEGNDTGEGASPPAPFGGPRNAPANQLILPTERLQ